MQQPLASASAAPSMGSGAPGPLSIGSGAPGPLSSPSSEPRYLVERPPEGIARGRVPVPWWVVASLAGLIVIAVLLFLALRHRRRQRQARYESIAPQSSRR